MMDWIAPLLELPWWSAIPMLALPLWLRRGLLGHPRVRAALLILSPLAVQLGFLLFTSWARVMKSWSPWPAIPGWPGLEALTALLPLTIAHALVSARPHEPLLASLRSRQNVRARLALFAWLVLAAYLTISGALAQDTALRVWVEESTPAGLASSLLALVVLLLLVPRLLLALLDTVPIEGYERRLAEEVSSTLGVRPPRLLEWRTDDELTNAMVLAMPFAPRPVLFTDAFRRQLSISEFRGVLAHELGHVAGRHVGVFASFVLGAALTVEALFGSGLEGPWGELYALAFLLLLVSAIGFISRRLELEADLFALEATGDRAGLSMALLRAGGRRVGKKSWRHFSTSRRMIFLRAASHDGGTGQRLRRSIKKLRRLSVLLLIVGAGAMTFKSAQRWPVERFWIDVRMANIERALERFAALDAEDFAETDLADDASPAAHARLEALLRLAASLQASGEELSTDSLGTLATQALQAGNDARVHALLDLAFLIADPDASRLAAALEGDDQSALALPSWEPVLASLTRTP